MTFVGKKSVQIQVEQDQNLKPDSDDLKSRIPVRTEISKNPTAKLFRKHRPANIILSTGKKLA
jgi:hypothetical protein